MKTDGGKRRPHDTPRPGFQSCNWPLHGSGSCFFASRALEKEAEATLGDGYSNDFFFFIKQQQMLSLQFSPSDWDLLRKRVLALGWSDGLASWARSATFKPPEALYCTHPLLQIVQLLENVQDVKPTVGEFPVADVLQVSPGVLTDVLGGGDRTLFQLQLPPADLGTLPRGDATRHGTSHGRGPAAVLPQPNPIQPGRGSPTVVLRLPAAPATCALGGSNLNTNPPSQWPLTEGDAAVKLGKALDGVQSLHVNGSDEVRGGGNEPGRRVRAAMCCSPTG